MIINSSVPLEPQAMMNRGIIPVPFFIIRKASRQMCRDNTDLSIGILHSNGNCSFVPRHARHSSLFNASFHIFDVIEGRSFDEDAQGSTDELSTSKKNILLAACCSSMFIQCFPYCLFPQLFPAGITIHDLLRTKLDNLLKPYGHNFWCLLGCVELGAQPG